MKRLQEFRNDGRMGLMVGLPDGVETFHETSLQNFAMTDEHDRALGYQSP
ncbi:MAG: hypothetical protein LH702_11385 [Phormidesmis sp. CAN_BIN44]|nr:hypothetical protein [Phormidesmis sp. CAN_BIN44]